MPTTEELWTEVAGRLGWEVPEPARHFLFCVGSVTRWERGEPGELARIEAILRCLAKSGLVAKRESIDAEQDPPTPAGKRDERWALWRDLRRRSADPGDDWRALRLGLVVDATNAALPGARVELSFDSRLSQSALIGEIRRLWPRLRAAHWVRDTKAMESRAEHLLRFVCLEEQPDTPWRDMMERWNERYPRWKHNSVRDFRSRFSRYEAQLTGHKYGLEWFYSTAARAAWESLADMDIGDLERAEEQGGTPESRAAARHIWPALSGLAFGLRGSDLGQVRTDKGSE